MKSIQAGCECASSHPAPGLHAFLDRSADRGDTVDTIVSGDAADKKKVKGKFEEKPQATEKERDSAKDFVSEIKKLSIRT